ncbi:zinc-binding dehydrogenase [Streptomyces sp. NPDC050448]|uniref:zinc-binding dehydrogenase n=1 Tax=Streptomyces sp. NPDC050448 TaxID=3155404 RepID=UPI00343EE3D1
MAVEADRPGVRETAALGAGGELLPHIAEILPLAQAGTPHEVSQSGRTSGKIVLTTRL